MKKQTEMEAKVITIETVQAEIEQLKNMLVINTKEVLTVAECAVYTNHAESYLYKLTSENKIPHYRPHGKKIYFKKSELDEWLLSKPVPMKKAG